MGAEQGEAESRVTRERACVPGILLDEMRRGMELACSSSFARKAWIGHKDPLCRRNDRWFAFSCSMDPI
jgi:hypothetical protein